MEQKSECVPEFRSDTLSSQAADEDLAQDLLK
jgi:hypothetical protein